MESAKVKLVKAKMDVIFSQVTAMYDASQKIKSGSLLEGRTQDDFLSLSSNLESLFTEFNLLCDQYNELNMQLNDKYQPNFSTWVSFEEMHSKVTYIRTSILEARKVTKVATSTSGTSNSTACLIKLPPIELQPFDGNRKNWSTFYECFKASVHNNKSLNNAQRIQYLIGKLTGKALSVVAGTLPNGENYETLWKALEEKYEDKRELGSFYISSMLDTRAPAANNAQQLSDFVECFASNRASLKQLGLADLDGFILLHIALKKIDPQLAQLFESSQRDKDIPELGDFVSFMRQQVKILERIGSSATTSRVNPAGKTSPSHTFAALAEQKEHCGVCKMTDHAVVYKCPKFLKMTPQSRFRFVKAHRGCINCLSDKHTCNFCKSENSCRTCQLKHHSLLHFERETKQEPTKSTMSADVINNKTSAPVIMHASSSCVTRNMDRTVVLSTAQVFASTSSDKKRVLLRCLIDNGSQQNLISVSSCRNFGFSIKPLSNSVIKTVGKATAPVYGYVSIHIFSRVTNEKFSVDLLVVDEITEKLPLHKVDTSSLVYLHNVPLADETWHTPGEVHAILGAKIFPHILTGNRLLPPSNLSGPAAIETSFGYIIMGNAPISWENQNTSVSFGPLIDGFDLQRFWELEQISVPSALNKKDEECEEIYSSSVKRECDGRYVVPLTFKGDPNSLGNSYTMAKRRWLRMERTLQANPSLRASYNSVFRDYIEKGYLSALPDDSPSIGYYIPHHAVIRPDKLTTKTRIVLDASARTDTNVSVNDILHTGPNLQADLFTLLLNFRLFPFALTADIQQMYLRIRVREEDRKFQKVLFRFNEAEPLQSYHFNSVAFGLACSPYLAMRTVKQLADDEQERFPLAAKAAHTEFYMDDLTTSVMTEKEAVELASELCALFEAGGFSLVKWASNSKDVLSTLPQSSLAPIEFNESANLSGLKVLGLQWTPLLDSFKFTVGETTELCTKRSILSTVARLFDVLGLVAPVILYAKLLIQELWLAKVDWDDIPPPVVTDRFARFKSELHRLSELSIPRHLGVVINSQMSLVGFGDASTKAYGAVIYLHITYPNGESHASLVCSKSKVAPVKSVTLARLELCAALLLSELIRKVWESYSTRYEIKDIFAFSDSTIALCWIHSEPQRFQTFVASRITKIQKNIDKRNFYHIDGRDNPCDCLSRGLLPSQLLDHPLWWTGPTWLQMPKTEWKRVKPFIPSQHSSDIPEAKKSLSFLTTATAAELPLYQTAKKVSSWSRLLRVLVYVLRFARKLPDACMNVSNLEYAETALLVEVQKLFFSKDLEDLKKKKTPSHNLRKLDPFVCENGLIRIGGRLANANIPFSNRHPVLLPRDDHVINLIIDHTHKTNCHTGSNLLMSLLRQKYWILSARNTIRKRIRNCNFCFKVAPSIVVPIMADLPAARVQQAKAFTHTGVDYAGPINITLTRRRGVKSQKAYICLFVCLTTKAIHIEIASDLTTDIFMNAFKRFLARRGPVSCIYSDNGTNFVGAKRQLDSLYELLQSVAYNDSLAKELAYNRITWKFIPPRAPHMGGLWEANVKSVKTHLYRVIGNQLLCYEELLTLLAQIECLLNSRPLCLLSQDPDPEVLTPSHFLMSTPLKHFPAADLSHENVNVLSRKQLLDSLVQSYWKKWHIEYLHTLQTKQKWNTPALPVTVGTVVLIHVDDTPPLRWPLGIIEEVHPGKDNVVRVATVRTSSGMFKRPIVKLCPLPTQ